jgi:CRP-like cAMP-binding protein
LAAGARSRHDPGPRAVPAAAGPGETDVLLACRREIAHAAVDVPASRDDLRRDMPHSHITETLARFPIFADCDPAALARAAGHLRWKDADAEEMVLDFDDPTPDVFLVQSGGLRVLIRTTGGHERILGDIPPGGVFGEMAAIAGAAAPPSAGVRALHRTRLGVLPGPAFVELIEASPVLALRLLRQMAGRVRALNARLLESAALPVTERLCSELLRLAKPQGGGGRAVVTPPPSRRELASRIGARREAVSRGLAELVRDGLIEVQTRAIVLRDALALREAVDRAYAQAGAVG